MHSVTFPHAFRPVTTRAIFWGGAFWTALPATAGIARAGWYGALIAFTAVGVSLVASAIGAKLAGRDPLQFIRSGQPLFSALLVFSFTPTAAGPGWVAMAAIFATLVGAWAFGGPNVAWLHPAALGVLLASAVVPLTAADATGVIAPWLVDPGLGDLSVPAWRLMFAGDGQTFTAGLILPILIASVPLMAEDLLPPILPAMTALAFVAVIAAARGLTPMLAGEVLGHLGAGSTAMVIFVGLLEPAPRPRTRTGMVIFALLLGSTIAAMSLSGRVVHPALVSIVLVGHLVPLIDTFTVSAAEVRR